MFTPLPIIPAVPSAEDASDHSEFSHLKLKEHQRLYLAGTKAKQSPYGRCLYWVSQSDDGSIIHNFLPNRGLLWLCDLQIKTFLRDRQRAESKSFDQLCLLFWKRDGSLAELSIALDTYAASSLIFSLAALTPAQRLDQLRLILQPSGRSVIAIVQPAAAPIPQGKLLKPIVAKLDYDEQLEIIGQISRHLSPIPNSDQAHTDNTLEVQTPGVQTHGGQVAPPDQVVVRGPRRCQAKQQWHQCSALATGSIGSKGG